MLSLIFSNSAHLVDSCCIGFMCQITDLSVFGSDFELVEQIVRMDQE